MIFIEVCHIGKLVSYVSAFTGVSFCIIVLICLKSKVVSEICINLFEFIRSDSSALFCFAVLEGGCICCINVVVTCCNKKLQTVLFFIFKENFSKTCVSFIFAVLCKVTGNKNIFELRISSCHCFNSRSDNCFTLRVKLCAALAVILISRTVTARKRIGVVVRVGKCCE